MNLPQYDGFYDDIQALYDEYSQITFPAGSNEAKVWHEMLEAMNQVVADEHQPYAERRQASWDQFLLKLKACNTGDLIEIYDGWDKTPAQQEEFARDYNRNFSEEKLERWRMDRETTMLRQKICTLAQNDPLQADCKAMGNYINAYMNVLNEVKTFDDEINKYESYDDLHKKNVDAVNVKKDLEKKLEKSLRDDTIPEMFEASSIEQLDALYKNLAKERRQLEQDIHELGKQIAEKKQVLDKAREEAEEVRAHQDEIEAEHQNQAKILEEKKQTLDKQAEKTTQSVIEEKKISEVISNAAQQNYEAQQKIEQINKEYERKQKGWRGFFRNVRGVFSSSVKEENQAITKKHEALTARMDLDMAEKNAELVRCAFDDLVRPGDKVNEMFTLGKLYSTGKEEKWKNLLDMPGNEYYHRRCLQVYRKKLEVEALLRKQLPDNLSPEEKEKVEKRLMTHEGMIKLANELVDLKNGVVEQLQLDKDYIEQMQEVEALTIMQKMNSEHIKGTETAIEDLQTDLKKNSNQLYQKDQDVKEQEKVVKDSSLESKLAGPIARQQAAADEYSDVRLEQEQLLKDRAAMQHKLNDISDKLTKLDNRLTLRKNLKATEDEINVQQTLIGKIMAYRDLCNGLAKKGHELKEKLGLDENGDYGKKILDQLHNNTIDGLHSLHITAIVGKEKDHKDTDAYHGMMDRYDALMANNGEAIKSMSQQELKDTLCALKTGAQNYIKAKEDQWFQSFRHSPMRKARLDFANELITFCDKQTDNVNKTYEKVEKLRTVYNDFVRTGVNGWKKTDMTMSDTFNGVKASKKTMANKTAQVDQERSLNAAKTLNQGRVPVAGNG